MEQKITNVLRRNSEAYHAGHRLIINQGGQGSSKTYSILQIFYNLAKHLPERRIFTICSYALPHLIKNRPKLMSRLKIKSPSDFFPLFQWCVTIYPGSFVQERLVMFNDKDTIKKVVGKFCVYFVIPAPFVAYKRSAFRPPKSCSCFPRLSTTQHLFLFNVVRLITTTRKF